MQSHPALFYFSKCFIILIYSSYKYVCIMCHYYSALLYNFFAKLQIFIYCLSFFAHPCPVYIELNSSWTLGLKKELCTCTEMHYCPVTSAACIPCWSRKGEWPSCWHSAHPFRLQDGVVGLEGGLVPVSHC